MAARGVPPGHGHDPSSYVERSAYSCDASTIIPDAFTRKSATPLLNPKHLPPWRRGPRYQIPSTRRDLYVSVLQKHHPPTVTEMPCVAAVWRNLMDHSSRGMHRVSTATSTSRPHICACHTNEGFYIAVPAVSDVRPVYPVIRVLLRFRKAWHKLRCERSSNVSSYIAPCLAYFYKLFERRVNTLPEEPDTPSNRAFSTIALISRQSHAVRNPGLRPVVGSKNKRARVNSRQTAVCAAAKNIRALNSDWFSGPPRACMENILRKIP